MITGIKAFIFDLDGTLIDTEKIYRQIWPITIKDMGLSMSDDQYLSLRSLGRPFAPMQMKKWFGDDFNYNKAREIRKKYFNEYINKYGIEAKTGAEELLQFLRSQGIITAIATATDLVRAKEYLDMVGLIKYFDKIISATEVDEGKPSPKVYQYACKQLNLLPEECIAVEDAPNGIISAKKAGLQVIMVPDQSQPDETLLKSIDYLVNKLDDIIALNLDLAK